MKTPTISICIPTYNRADLLKDTLDSVARQTVKPYEVLVIDNASTDNTEELVRKYKQYGIRYIRHEKNIGMAENFNACVDLAQSEYFTILPSDDLIAPTWYEEWTRVIKKHDAVLYTSPITIVDNNRTILWALPIFESSRLLQQPHVRREFEKRFTPGVPPTAMSVFRKSVIQQIGRFNPTDSTEFDVRIMLPLFDKGDVYYHNRFLYALREHPYRAFDDQKATKDKRFEARLENTFRILSELWEKQYQKKDEHRHFIHCTLFMNLCNINLYIARLEFKKVIRSYRLCLKYFPDLFHKWADWKAFFYYQAEFIRRALVLKKVAKKYRNELKWIS